jgi:aspartate aminotransferase/aminotransferase
MKEKLAQRMRHIDASGIRKVFALAADLKDPINFSIGQPDFDVPQALQQEAIKAIMDGHNRYSQTAGDQQLKQRINEHITREYGWTDPTTLVTSGVSGGLLLAFMALIDPGDEVIIPDPYFVIYKHAINLLGGKCVFVNSYTDFRLPVQGIRQAVTSKTKMIIINSPCNPTGIVYSKDELQSIAHIAREHDIIVLSDEIYKAFTYDDVYSSIAPLYDKTLLMGGFGKAYAMTGWRLGYVTVQPVLRPVLEAMTTIQQYTFVCAPTPFQKAAIAALDYDISPYVEAYQQKRDILYEGLKHSFDIVKPAGAFYAFVKTPQGNATSFVKKAIANNVLIIPGNVFSEQDTHFRISYATSEDKIRQGVQVLKGLGNE